MINACDFYRLLKEAGIDFYTGVPDSTLKDFCAYVTDTVPPDRHIITANEGGAVALASGHYLGTGKAAMVYMQNSGLGNAVNPLVSLADPDVYTLPLLLLVGFRGEPGVKDEPQHKKMGKITIPLLETLDIQYDIMPNSYEGLQIGMKKVKKILKKGRSFAFVVRIGTFAPYELKRRSNPAGTMTREEAVSFIAGKLHDEAVIVSTTGKISRELYEYREECGFGHERDFLTVGSMGHVSHIAVGIALAQRQRQVYCFDGDGSVIMHLGSLGINGTCAPSNFRHIVFNNAAHDSVGGQPTCGTDIDLVEIARGCGYRYCVKADCRDDLESIFPDFIKIGGPAFLEVRVKKGARKDLGRPHHHPQDLKRMFMQRLGVRE